MNNQVKQPGRRKTGDERIHCVNPSCMRKLSVRHTKTHAPKSGLCARCYRLKKECRYI